MTDSAKSQFLASILNKGSGERYAGIMLGVGGARDYHLVLVWPRARLDWHLANSWAANHCAYLPTPRDMCLLLANLPDQFAAENGNFYWTSQCSDVSRDHA